MLGNPLVEGRFGEPHLAADADVSKHPPGVKPHHGALADRQAVSGLLGCEEVHGCASTIRVMGFSAS